MDEAYFGADGKPTLGKRGFARVTYRYDERGNQIEWDNFDTVGKPIANTNGIARAVFGYDERGNQVEVAYFGTDGKPVLSKMDGVARVVYRYDERGNQIEWSDFDTVGKPVVNNNGIARGLPLRRARQQGGRGPFRRRRKANCALTLPLRRARQRGGTSLFRRQRKTKLSARPTATTSAATRWRRPTSAPTDTLQTFLPLLVGGPNTTLRIEIVMRALEDALGRPVLIDQIGAQVRYSYGSETDINGATYFDERGHVIPIEVKICQVVPGSVAQGISLASGDWLLAYDGESIKSKEQVVFMVTHTAPGIHELTFRRGHAFFVRERIVSWSTDGAICF